MPNAAKAASATVKENLTVNSCPSCGALPCDWVENPWAGPPWIVHFDMAHYPKFLIDQRDANNANMFSGYKINGSGEIARQSETTGQGGRLAFHRSHFVEELPE